MKAAVYMRYGPPDVVEIRELDKPVPNEDQVLVRVRAASVNPADWRLIKGVPLAFRILFRLRRPTPERPGRPGRDVAGQAEAIGPGVTQFKPGDEVFGWCEGAFAEFVCAPESALVLKPKDLKFEEGASVGVAAITALQGLRDRGKIRKGHHVLVNGAAGGVGTFAVQFAKAFDTDVTGVCSTGNLELVRSLGGDRVIDYTREDCTKGSQTYDLILDCVGNLSLLACRRLLKPGGACVIVGGSKNPGLIVIRALVASVLSLLGSRKYRFFIAKLKKEDLALVGQMMATGKVKAVIDRRYSLSEAREAIRYLEEGHARGKVVVTVA